MNTIDPRREIFQIARRAGRCTLYAVGPDDVFGTADDVVDTYR